MIAPAPRPVDLGRDEADPETAVDGDAGPAREPAPPDAPGIWRGLWARPATRIVFVAVAYYLGARIGLLPALVRGQVTPFWPPTGIAVACLLMLGTRTWPGITIAAIAVNAPLGPNALAVGAIAAGNTLAPLVAVTLLRKASFRTEVDRLRDGVALITLGALGGMAVSATIGSAALSASHAVELGDFGSTWMVWWTGDAMGVLVIAPVIFLLGRLPTRAQLEDVRRWRVAEACAAAIAVEAVAIYTTLNDTPGVLLVAPVLIWSAIRFQQAGAALAVLAISVTAANAAASGHGFFASGSLVSNMLQLQLYNGSAALTGLLLAAVIAQRNESRRQLAESNRMLERRIEQRSAQLAHDRSRIAVLADRHRIATELHDIVIQRLFGTGAALDAAASTLDDAVARERLNRVVEQLDATINDLRASIFQIEHDVETATLHEAVAHVLAAASHSLGFLPDLTVHGDQESIPHAVRPQLLATLQEVLNDVEQHPGVTNASVDLNVVAGEFVMTISESGPHLRPAEPRGAMHRVLARAERLGGSCLWRFDGRQTVFEWRIPVPDRR